MYGTQFHYELSMNTRRYSNSEPQEYDLSIRPLPSYIKRFLMIAGIITVALATSVVSYAAPSTVKTSSAYLDCCSR